MKTKNVKGEDMSINHNCAQMDEQVSELMGVNKVLLEKIIFCHQEEMLWMFQDQQYIINIFEEVFDTKKFGQLIDEIKQKLKENQKQNIVEVQINNEIKQQILKGYLEGIELQDKLEQME